MTEDQGAQLLTLETQVEQNQEVQLLHLQRMESIQYWSNFRLDFLGSVLVVFVLIYIAATRKHLHGLR